MIFRSRKRSPKTAEPASGPSAPEEVADDGRPVEHLLQNAHGGTNGGSSDEAGARRILQLRHLAGLKLLDENPAKKPVYPDPAFDLLAGDSGLPTVDAGQVTPELLRAAILRRGCLLSAASSSPSRRPGCSEIDRPTTPAAPPRRVRGRSPATSRSSRPIPGFDLAFERALLLGSAGLWVADSPRMMAQVLDIFHRAGLTRLATEYLGEPRRSR